VTEQFTGRTARAVPLEATLEGCERILADAFSETPERALYMIGRIEEAATAAPTPEEPPSPETHSLEAQPREPQP
jgi:F0F1-type ATP synthase beta subunit